MYERLHKAIRAVDNDTIILCKPLSPSGVHP